jgi:ribonuclease VapC
MVVDASAVLAILLGEEDAAFYADAIEDAADIRMSAVSALEVVLVIGARKREQGLVKLDRFMGKSRIQVIAFDAEQLELAHKAWWSYGKGRHAAGLNLGDCCSYALAKMIGEVLKSCSIRATISREPTCKAWRATAIPNNRSAACG